MNNINKIIQQRESEFDEKFVTKIDGNIAIIDENFVKPCEIKQFQKETNKMIIDEVVRIVRSKLKEDLPTGDSLNSLVKTANINGYDQALLDIIKELRLIDAKEKAKDFKESIKKLSEN